MTDAVPRCLALLLLHSAQHSSAHRTRDFFSVCFCCASSGKQGTHSLHERMCGTQSNARGYFIFLHLLLQESIVWYLSLSVYVCACVIYLCLALNVLRWMRANALQHANQATRVNCSAVSIGVVCAVCCRWLPTTFYVLTIRIIIIHFSTSFCLYYTHRTD